MSAVAIARSSLLTALTRYSRSWGVWILLLVSPIGARLFIPRGDGTTITISVAGQLPEMTSAVIGVCLGVVVSTLMLPAGYVYLRANTNRRQPWQVEEVSPAARVPIALGRFGADVVVLFGALAALNLAGCFLGWLILPAGTLDLLALSFALWVIAAPALMGLAAIRILFDAVPALRGALGDVAYFILWITALALPAAIGATTGFRANLHDFGGFVRPLTHGVDLKDPDFTIGGADVKPGRIPIDPVAGLLSPGYLPSRLAWAGIAVGVAGLAGLVYRPHRVRTRARIAGRVASLLQEGAPPLADSTAPPALSAPLPWLTLIATEFRLIGAGRLFKLLAALVAGAGLFTETAPAALLLLVFALTSHAGRTESRGLAALTATMPQDCWARRAAFVVAGTAWSVLLMLPRAVVTLDPAALGLAAALGGSASIVAIALAALSGSGFAPRIVLLLAWYAYTSA